jgi:hypothetical protein
MNIKTTNLKKYFFSMLAISSPVWLPISGAYAIKLYSYLAKVHTSSFDESVIMLLVLGSFVLGNSTLAKVANLPRGQEFFLLLVYSFVAIVFLFFSGWSALMMLGYY